MKRTPWAQQARVALVVDDEQRIAEAVAMNLELEGFQVLTASSGEEALEKVTEELPDIVILDVMMPDVDEDDRDDRRHCMEVPVHEDQEDEDKDEPEEIHHLLRLGER